MGVGVSNWRLAQAVSKLGQLGVVSGTALDALFAAHQQGGRVVMEFSTWVHLGQLTSGSNPS